MKDIVPFLKQNHGVNEITDIPTIEKINFICYLLDINKDDLDSILSDYSPVFRTIKGHVFETYFDELLKINGYTTNEVGGDTSIDRVVNQYSLQLKTPYTKGSSLNQVQYKCHKTHGAKSENESMSYYHSLHDFPDYLIGLISYNPLKILVLNKNLLPTINKDNDILYIKSPFTIDLNNNPYINAFHLLDLKIDLNTSIILTPSENELLPKTANKCGLNSEVIINTILNKNNFRIWDMAIKGFAREYAFQKYAAKNHIKLLNPSVTQRPRYEKADFVIKNNTNYDFYQMKGLSINNCIFNPDNLIVAVETQLTRGRVNDHPTQSRLYLTSDFDFLLLAIDPVIANKFNPNKSYMSWEFYKIPVNKLCLHHKYGNRLSSLQKFNYSYLQEFKI